jgi:hypothetical protein
VVIEIPETSFIMESDFRKCNWEGTLLRCWSCCELKVFDMLRLELGVGCAWLDLAYDLRSNGSQPCWVLRFFAW